MEQTSGVNVVAAANADIKGLPNKVVKAAKTNWLFEVLGSPTFIAGNGRQYPRTEGFGPARKPHSDGGTNETVAFVTFAPFGDSDLTLEGRIYCERYADKARGGKMRKDFNVSLSFIKCPPRSASRNKINQIANEVIMALYLDWRDKAPVVKGVKASAAVKGYVELEDE